MHAEVTPHVPSLIGGGEMGQLVRSTDWSATPLGSYESWSPSLRSALSLVLNSNGIAALYWGPEQWLLYNDAYGEALGDRHPAAFGRPMPEVLTDIAPVLGPQVAEVLRTGQGFANEDVPLTMHRAGRDPATWWTYSFSPIQGEEDGFAGVLLLATETTDQKKREQSDHRKRTRVEVALRVARLGAYDWNTATGNVVLDARAREIFGLPAEGLIDEADVFGRMAPEDVARTQAEAEDAVGRTAGSGGLEAGQQIDASYDIVLPNGTRRSIASTGTVITGEDGSRHMLGAFNDVTAFKRAEAQLVSQNATLEERVSALAAERDQLWRLSRDPFVICDLEGRWISASPVWTEILGWQIGELLGRTSSWMEHPDDVSRTKQKVVDTAGGEVTLAFTNRFRGKDDSYRTFSWTAVSEGAHLICVARDVTDEIARADALRLYANIVNSDLAPILAFDTEHRQIAFNQAHCDDFYRTYGHKVEIGEVFPDLLLPDQAPMIRGFMDRALAGETFTVTAEVGDPDLTVPHWELSYSPLKAEDGTVIGAFHHAKDVSPRMRMQAELAQTQEVLRQAQKMEAVGQLTGGLAHDFNNLLTGIMGNLELLQLRVARGRLDNIDRFVTAAQGAGRRAASLTQRLLAFSRRQTLDPRPTDVNRLIAGMEDLLRRSVGGTAQIEVVGAAGLWTANIDAAQLENALLNLCNNARDAMPDGGRITIETANKWLDERTARERDLSPGQYISICVSDTGTGMSADTIARAFEPFFTTKPIGQGTGLGLSMIYGFARQSGGQVRIYSEVGQGTTICVYLPRFHGDAGEAEVEETIRAVEGARGQTILVVDDEATIRHLIDEVLDDAGYTVINAADGAAGLKVLQSGARIELLITDVGLPGGMNGRQVADAARALRPGLKVLFITGYAENAAVGNGHLEPGMELLTKPFSMDALTAKVDTMMTTKGDGAKC